jgi:hypothetical protein
MTTNATLSLTFAAKLMLAAGVALYALPAAAQRQPITEPETSVRDVAMTPLNDLNLTQDEVPTVLELARAEPYSRQGITSCEDILRHVGDLDAVLGDDFDTDPPEDRSLSVTNLAQRVIGSFIPFRGIIREISGANAAEFRFREAIAAGLMRRAYLKGIGQEMNCPYPASPATPELVARLNAQRAAAEAREEAGDEDAGDEPAATTPQVDDQGFYSEPVVQAIN